MFNNVYITCLCNIISFSFWLNFLSISPLVIYSWLCTSSVYTPIKFSLFLAFFESIYIFYQCQIFVTTTSVVSFLYISMYLISMIVSCSLMFIVPVYILSLTFYSYWIPISAPLLVIFIILYFLCFYVNYIFINTVIGWLIIIFLSISYSVTETSIVLLIKISIIWYM